MTAETLEALRTRLRNVDRDILRALGARARKRRHPHPVWPTEETRLPPPPLTEILLAISPAGTAETAPDAENHALTSALLARQRLAMDIANAKFEINRADVLAAMETGDRDKLLALLTDLPVELRRLDDIHTAAAELAPNLAPDLSVLLWREYIIPWTRQSEVTHLLTP